MSTRRKQAEPPKPKVKVNISLTEEFGTRHQTIALPVESATVELGGVCVSIDGDGSVTVSTHRAMQVEPVQDFGYRGARGVTLNRMRYKFAKTSDE